LRFLALTGNHAGAASRDPEEGSRHDPQKAIQIGAALKGGCASFVTNDRDLPKIPGLQIVQLRDLLKSP
jgi:hypothetical protein